MPAESTILCEGYYDRAFWTGCLLALGCTDAGKNPDGTRKKVFDLASRAVTGGQYGFLTGTGNFIRIVPCRGKANILPEARDRLHRRHTDPIRRLVINIDPDNLPGGSA